MAALLAASPLRPSTYIRSPVFDFDQEWVDHISTVRAAATATQTMVPASSPWSSQPPPSADPASTFSMSSMMFAAEMPADSMDVETAYLGWAHDHHGALKADESTIPPVMWADVLASWPQQQQQGDPAAEAYYSSAAPRQSSYNSTLTISSPSSSSRGSKRSWTAESSPTFKRRRLNLEAARQQVFYLENDDDDEEQQADNDANSNLNDDDDQCSAGQQPDDDDPGFEGAWEVVQGAWEVSGSAADSEHWVAPQSAPVIRVREMPRLREPMPRLPTRVFQSLALTAPAL